MHGPKEESKQNAPLELEFTSNCEIAEEYNSYFANVGPNLFQKSNIMETKPLKVF